MSEILDRLASKQLGAVVTIDEVGLQVIATAKRSGKRARVRISKKYYDTAPWDAMQNIMRFLKAALTPL